ncbi:hypothetical protein GCM10028833_15490 [Glycomyces tarimensis]
MGPVWNRAHRSRVMEVEVTHRNGPVPQGSRFRKEPSEEITDFIAQISLDRLLPNEPDCRNMSNIPIERHQRHGQ